MCVYVNYNEVGEQKLTRGPSISYVTSRVEVVVCTKYSKTHTLIGLVRAVLKVMIYSF
jgi:transcription initiation factor TFIIIB Brf1 subunit/transcription initiation factor TFIIB